MGDNLTQKICAMGCRGAGPPHLDGAGCPLAGKAGATRGCATRVWYGRLTIRQADHVVAHDGLAYDKGPG